MHRMDFIIVKGDVLFTEDKVSIFLTFENLPVFDVGMAKNMTKVISLNQFS